MISTVQNLGQHLLSQKVVVGQFPLSSIPKPSYAADKKNAIFSVFNTSSLSWNSSLTRLGHNKTLVKAVGQSGGETISERPFIQSRWLSLKLSMDMWAPRIIILLFYIKLGYIISCLIACITITIKRDQDWQQLYENHAALPSLVTYMLLVSLSILIQCQKVELYLPLFYFTVNSSLTLSTTYVKEIRHKHTPPVHRSLQRREAGSLPSCQWRSLHRAAAASWAPLRGRDWLQSAWPWPRHYPCL